MIKKILILTLILLTLPITSIDTEKGATLVLIDEITLLKGESHLLKKEAREANKAMVEVASLSQDIPYLDVSLDRDIQRHIYYLSEEYGLSFTWIMALIKWESNNFQTDLVSDTNDWGLMQLNDTPTKYGRSTMEWLADSVGIGRENFDPLDPYQNTMAGIWYMDYLRDRRIESGMSEEDAYVMTMLSYNRGEGGANKYVRDYGWSAAENYKYVIMVDKYKEEFDIELEEKY